MLRLAAATWLALALPAGAGVVAADYADPTARYGHGVLGDAVEWGTLTLRERSGRQLSIRLPQTRVFEDTAPRLADVDGDGEAEVITVETDLALGARLSIYGPRGLIAATPFIGRPNRWLAPAGAADLDGDGRVEIADVDRPHLVRRLRIWRLEGTALREIAALDGVTNHRIGDPEISGGVRDCGAGPELVLLSADWTRVVAVRMPGPVLRDLGPNGPGAVARALDCG